VNFSGGARIESTCHSIVRGALALYGLDQAEKALALVALIASKDNFTSALKAIVRQHFGDAGWEPQIIIGV